MIARDIRPGMGVRLVNRNWLVAAIENREWFLKGLKSWLILNLQATTEDQKPQLDFMVMIDEEVLLSSLEASASSISVEKCE